MKPMVSRHVAGAKHLAVYAIVAAVTIALFIALHLAGNRLSFDLAVERLAEEFHATHGEDWGMRGGLWQDKWHYCEFSAAVLSGARAARDGGGGLREAILLRSIPSPDECDNLKAAVLQGVWFEDIAHANLRHWLGGKAIYAIALRYITVRQFYIAIKALIYCGFVALVLALYLVGRRTLLVVSPLLAFGLFVSALEQHSNIGEGLPFAWALFATALGVVLLRRSPPMSAARLFFFFAGMVSHYLWFFDGGNFVAATLIGLIAWLVPETDSLRQRIAWAAACVGVYTAGFVVSLVFRIVLTNAMSEAAFGQFATRTGHLLERISTPLAKDLAGADFGIFQTLARIDAPTLDWLLLTAATALVLAATIGGHRAWRRRNRGLLVEVLWLGALFLPSVAHFLLPSDAPSRAARLMFLPLGLSWCCLLAFLTTLPRRQIVAWSTGIGLALALSYGVIHLASQREYEGKLASARLLSASQEDGRFALYLLDTQGETGAGPDRPDATRRRKLIYRKSPCSAKDLRSPLHLHLLAPTPSLPEQWRQLGFVNTGLLFFASGQVFLGTCHASVRLPDYAKGIRTGQAVYIRNGHEYKILWQLEIDLPI